jgi:integrase
MILSGLVWSGILCVTAKNRGSARRGFEGMNVTKRGKYYSYRFEFEGRQIRKTTGVSNKEAARQMGEEHRRRLKLGEDTPKRKAIKFTDAVKELIESKPKWSEKTKVVHNTSMTHLKPFFGEMLLSEIVTDSFTKYQSMRLKEKTHFGKRPAGRTINIELALVRLVLRKYKQWERVNDEEEVEELDENEDTGRALKPVEKDRLLAAARKSISRSLYPAVQVALNTGLRSEEMRLLKWEQVDLLLHPSITVGKSKTKGGTGRIVPINQTALEVLKSWRTNFPDAKPTHFVFPAERYKFEKGWWC